MTDAGPTVVGGRYELGELLGRGGMAEVRAGKDTRLGRVVAVKRLRTDLASDTTFQARFRREAQSSASLNHPSIVAVYDTGEEPAGDGSGVAQPYIVMEFVAGRTLRDILREGRKILPERALEITSGVLSALDYSHRAGIIHRDIKPGNVMLTPAGDVKVMDFGIARAISDAASTMTQTAAVVGTAQYLSPEQARGETVDPRSDVYSTGCLLYELLTGRPPFVGDSPVAVAYQHVREQAAPPSDHDTELTPEVDAIVMKALTKRLEDRYQSAGAMRADIERYLAGRPVQAGAVVPVPAPPVQPVLPPIQPPVQPPAPMPEPAQPRPVRPVGRRRPRVGLLLLIGLLALVIIGAGAYAANKLLFDTAPDQVQVPSLVGKTNQEARAAIGDAGLTAAQPTYAYSKVVKLNHVISQSPVKDSFVDPDSSVAYVLSKGVAQVGVPSVLNELRGAAKAQLVKAGFKVTLTPTESDTTKNTVLSTMPAPGTPADPGSTVVVTYSQGPHEMPKVVGLTKAQATQLITAQGFVPTSVPSSDTTQPAGTVIQQIPLPGTPEPQGASVTIVVSTYVKPSQSPSPTSSSSPSSSPTPGSSGSPTTGPGPSPSPRRQPSRAARQPASRGTA